VLDDLHSLKAWVARSASGSSEPALLVAAVITRIMMLLLMMAANSQEQQHDGAWGVNTALHALSEEKPLPPFLPRPLISMVVDLQRDELGACTVH